ncbi:MAG: hypothetical protein KME14_20435 [Tildeniella torsiva UHER 1998/13D]|nr:hypothetical protein [Tildeniella torsiva UHER 1998/13D]
MLHTLLQVPVEINDGAVAIPTEFLVAAGFGAMLWAFKWLAAREFKRFTEVLEKHDRAIEVLQKSDSTQQIDLAQIARLEANQQQIQKQLARADKDLAMLPKQSATLERVLEAHGQLNEKVQRLENVKFALKQAQELLQQTQKDVLQLKAEIAAGYITEEKYVREMTVLTSRIDAVWERMDQSLGARRRLLAGPANE